MDASLQELLTSSTLGHDAVTELTRLGVTKIELLGAVSSEESLQTLLIDRIKWQGSEELHIAKGLGLSLAWRNARDSYLALEQTAARRAANGEPPILANADRQAKLVAYRKRNNTSVTLDVRPADKLWDVVAAEKINGFLPYVALEKLVSFNESSQTVKKITKDDDGVEH